jgi:hypothetical protein
MTVRHGTRLKIVRFASGLVNFPEFRKFPESEFSPRPANFEAELWAHETVIVRLNSVDNFCQSFNVNGCGSTDGNVHPVSFGSGSS